MKKKYSKNSLNEIYEAAEKINRREPRLEEILATEISYVADLNKARPRLLATHLGHTNIATVL